MIRAIVQTAAGGPFTPTTIDAPAPGPGQILLRVAAVGLNPVDYKLAKNGWPSWTWPHVAGVDAAGVVEALGPDVDGPAPGTRVAVHADMGGPGVFAELAAVPAAACFAVPEAVPLTTAAALPCAGITAALAVWRKFPPPAGDPGDSVALVHAGAGGVGGFAVQLLARQGLRVIATCSPANDDALRALGASELIHYAEEDVTARLRESTAGRGADRIVSLVDRATATTDLVDRLAYGGHLACVVGLADLGELKPFTRSASIHEIALGACHLVGDARGQADLARLGAELVALVAAGSLDPRVAEVLDFDAIPDGLERLAGRHVAGKLVARIPDGPE